MSDEPLLNGTSDNRVEQNRQNLADVLSGANMAPRLSQLRGQVLQLLVNRLQLITNRGKEPELPDAGTPEWHRREIVNTLNTVGPAAASAALEHAFKTLNNAGKLRADLKQRLQGRDYVSCARMVLNDGGFVGDGLPGFNNVLRQFLLPRYAYLDFDMVVDPRHRVDIECGYPKFITPIMYRYMYDRDDMGMMVNDLYSNETWAGVPCIFDEESEDITSPFEEKLRYYIEERNLLQTIYRMDKLSGIGHYGALLIGIDDGKELDQPVAGIDEWNRPVTTDLRGRPLMNLPVERQMLFMRPFDEYLSFVQQYETNVNSPRYGQPIMYNLVFLDMTIDAAGASIGTRLNRRVHWTRVVHCMPNERQSSLVFAIPRMQRVFNRLLDIRKMKGASAEGLWNAGFPGIVFEADPQFIADDPDFDKSDFKRQTQEFQERLSRSITLEGIKAYMLQANLTEPTKFIEPHIKAIAMAMGVPIRILLGVEEARVSGSQEELAWNKRLGRHIRMNTVPYLIRPIIDRMIAMRLLPIPKNGRYCIEWPDLNKPTDEDKANLSLKWTQALSQYVASGVIHLVPPMDYLTIIMGLQASDAIRMLEQVKKLGGWQMLLKVDPSEVANNQDRPAGRASKAKGTTSERPQESNASDKQISGSES